MTDGVLGANDINKQYFDIRRLLKVSQHSIAN